MKVTKNLTIDFYCLVINLSSINTIYNFDYPSSQYSFKYYKKIRHSL